MKSQLRWLLAPNEAGVLFAKAYNGGKHCKVLERFLKWIVFQRQSVVVVVVVGGGGGVCVGVGVVVVVVVAVAVAVAGGGVGGGGGVVVAAIPQRDKLL